MKVPPSLGISIDALFPEPTRAKKKKTHHKPQQKTETPNLDPVAVKIVQALGFENRFGQRIYFFGDDISEARAQKISQFLVDTFKIDTKQIRDHILFTDQETKPTLVFRSGVSHFVARKRDTAVTTAVNANVIVIGRQATPCPRGEGRVRTASDWSDVYCKLSDDICAAA